jgi:hypothetical protein
VSSHEQLPDKERIALAIQQPWAELILQGKKTIEIRSTMTNQRGHIYVYASRKASPLPCALVAAAEHQLQIEQLPRGVILGTVELMDARPAKASDALAACVPAEILAHRQAWILQNPSRLKQELPPRFLPYGIWFYPFQRKPAAGDS